MSELALLLLKINLAAAAGIAAALILRGPVRALVGARLAYWLWALPPAAALAAVLPARVVTTVVSQAAGGDWAPAPSMAMAMPAAPPTGLDLARAAVAVWIAGAVLSLARLAWRQARFDRAARRGSAGPAAVGIVRPRIVLPDDFAQRYNVREQAVILAHERTHLARQDPRINALVALVRCALWLNPLAHLAEPYFRIDQELACDAAVVSAHPKARRAYAEALFKTQLALSPPPLGCHWPSERRHPLTERVRLLSHVPPGRARLALGAAGLALATLSTGWAVWAASPPRHETVWAAAAAPAKAWAPGADAMPAPRSAEAAAPAHTTPASSDPAQIPAATALADEAEDAPHLTLASAPLAEQAPPASEDVPQRRIWRAAERSSVEPGKAVRVFAKAVDPEGRILITDLTSYGSQSRFRTGRIEQNGSRYQLFTAVAQAGDLLTVTAAPGGGFGPAVSRSVTLRSGETGRLQLPNGLAVEITPTLRDETPEERAAAEVGRRPPLRRVWTPWT